MCRPRTVICQVGFFIYADICRRGRHAKANAKQHQHYQHYAKWLCTNRPYANCFFAKGSFHLHRFSFCTFYSADFNCIILPFLSFTRKAFRKRKRARFATGPCNYVFYSFLFLMLQPGRLQQHHQQLLQQRHQQPVQCLLP